MKIPTTLDRKTRKKWLTSPALAIVLALLLMLSSLPVYAGEQQTDQTETPTVTQDAGSESAQSAASSEQSDPLADELEPIQPIDPQEPEVAATEDWTQTKPHEGQVLHGGYVGFMNKASGKYLTVPNGTTSAVTNVCQQSTTHNMVHAQEFLLQYYYNVDYDLANFTIYPLTSSGTVVINMRIKADTMENGLANVLVQPASMLVNNERWQIEHVTGTYYCIYWADNPDSASIKYALTANNASDSTNPAIGDVDNVYVSAYTGEDSQLWQICADGIPMDINGYDITQGGSQEAILGSTVSYYYVPKAFNSVLLWSVLPSGMATSYGGGHFVPKKYGEMTVNLKYSVPNGNLPVNKSAVLFAMPATGEYYIANAGTGRYMDIEGPSTQVNAIIQQWDFHTGDYEKWRITNDSATLGYVRIRSLYSKKYLAVDSSNTGVIKQTLTLDDYSLWKIETTSHGNIKLICKASESNSVVLSVPLSANSNGTNLTTVSYTNNDNYRDEWSLYQFNATLEVEHYYDQGFTVRYQSFDDAEDLIESYQEFVAERYLHEFGLEIVPTYTAITSSADLCKGTVTSSNLSSACTHGTNGGCLKRDNLFNDVSPGSVTKSIVLWTGHILYNNQGSAMQTTGSFRIVITPSQVVYSSQGYINQSEEDTYVNYVFSLMHELSHSMGANDHYCTKKPDKECTNNTCDQCVLGYDEIRICLMGERKNVAELIVENTFCLTCREIISDHTRDHH